MQIKLRVRDEVITLSRSGAGDTGSGFTVFHLALNLASDSIWIIVRACCLFSIG